ncbi:hypothetical protein HW115_01005 [Verrucomicrobiaceae bacterium N1E253]|uniref:Uncharacterized protein n=1 Tax=Oceaniferula marina TaxID=2748318 RepID=A0A851G988_9BACT|nr:hypothetical protein [Oceaniferula marina]NWK54173.1 hypothetical protein [Oceaniferula marina]
MMDAPKQHGGVHKKFSDFRETIFKPVGEKKVDDFVVLGSLVLSVHCFFLPVLEPSFKSFGRTLATLKGMARRPQRQPIPRCSIGCRCCGLRV